MIYSLNGTLLEKDLSMAVIECAGVGYKVHITNTCLSALPDIGQKTRLYTHMNVREDSVELYGFADQKERDCFQLLIGVSGVGPKVALSILSELSPTDFAVSVISGDHARITKANGVGPKVAQRVVLELKDKLQKQQGDLLEGKEAQPVQMGMGEKSAEIIGALMVLGYTQHEAKRAVGALDLTTMSVEQAIKAALSTLMG